MQNLYGMFVGATHANGVCATAAVAGKWKMNVFDRGEMLGEWSILLLLCARFLPMCLCLSVCHKSVFYRNGWTNRAVLAWELPSTYPTVCYKELQAPSKMRVLSSGTLLQTLDFENFGTAYRTVKRVINLAGDKGRSEGDDWTVVGQLSW